MARQAECTQLDAGETIVSACVNPQSGKLIAVTSDGRVLQFEAADNAIWKELRGPLKVK